MPGHMNHRAPAGSGLRGTSVEGHVSPTTFALRKIAAADAARQLATRPKPPPLTVRCSLCGDVPRGPASKARYRVTPDNTGYFCPKEKD